MHARSITIVGDPRRLDAGIDFVAEEVQPEVIRMDGCMGLSMLVDRATGHCIVTSAWHDEESMRAGEARLETIHAPCGEILGGVPVVERWKIVVMHRERQAPAGACCRVTWRELGQSDVERGLEAYRTMVLPRVEAMTGFCSANVVVEPGTGRSCTTVAFDSREACFASRRRAMTIRSDASAATGATVTDVVEFDLPIAQLRLPELV